MRPRYNRALTDITTEIMAVGMENLCDQQCCKLSQKLITINLLMRKIIL